MTTCKAIIFILCYIIVVLLIYIFVVEPTTTVSSVTYQDKIIIGDKLIERKQLEKLVNTITSSPKTEAFAKRFGIEIIPAPPELILHVHTPETVYDLDPNGTTTKKVDPLLTNMIEEVEEFFQKKPLLAYQALQCYLYNKHDSKFWEKVDNFVKEN